MLLPSGKFSLCYSTPVLVFFFFGVVLWSFFWSGFSGRFFFFSSVFFPVVFWPDFSVFFSQIFLYNFEPFIFQWMTFGQCPTS